MSNHDHHVLARRLDGLLRRVRRRVALHGVAVSVAVGGSAFLAAAWVVGGAPAPARWALWGLGLSLLVLLTLTVARFLVAPLRRFRDRRELVGRVEAGRDHANLLVAAEESLRRPDRWSDDGPVAALLVARLHTEASRRLGAVAETDVAPLPRRGLLAGAALAVTGAALVLAALAGPTLRQGLVRLTTPWTPPPPPPTAGIYGLPGPAFAVAGDTVTLEALDLAAGDDAAVLQIRRGAGHWQDTPAVLADAGRRGPGRTWRAEVADVREDLQWRFRRGTIVAPARPLTVRELPLLSALAARVVPPAYTGLAPRDLATLPAWLEVPEGSLLELRGTANHELVAAAAVLAHGDTVALGTTAREVTGALPVLRSLAFTVHLADAWGLDNTNPLRYEVAASADRAPAVELDRPENDGLLPLDGAVSLGLVAADDYGVADLILSLRVVAGGAGRAAWQDLPLPRGGGTDRRWQTAVGEVGGDVVPEAGDAPPLDRRLALDLRLGELDLVAGDVVELAATVTDNRQPPPGGRGRSRVLRLLVPSAGEVLARQAESAEERQGEMSEARRRSRELAADLDRLNRELLKNPQPDWSRQQEIEEAIRRQQVLQEELGRLAAELNRELADLARSQLASEEQLRRAEEVADLLEPSNGERLSDLVRRLEEGEEAVEPQEVAWALRDAMRQQQEAARKLDAALAVLERMAREQELEGMTSLLEQIIQEQQELVEQSEQLAAEQAAEEQAAAEQTAAPDSASTPAAGDPQDGSDEAHAETSDESPAESGAGPEPDAGELARRQEALAEELDRLQEQLAATLEEMRERSEAGEESPGEEAQRQNMADALAELQEQMSEGRMEEAARQLEELSPDQAAQLQEQALRDLGSLYHVLLETQMAMQMAMQMNQAMSLRGLAADLLAVSARQEEIADTVPPRLRDVRSRGLTRSQHRLQQATISVRDGLAELVAESPTRIVQLLEKLDALIEDMGRTVRALEENRAVDARRRARQGLAAVNRAVIGMLTEAQMSMSGSGGASGQPDPSQQLQDLARQQAGLNGATEALRRMLADRGLSQQTRAEMKRLGQEQADLAARLREVEEDQRLTEREGDRLLGDLHELGQDMESIAGDLDQGLVDEDVLVRQDRILGRMLDARNSVRRRDYSSRRESRTADRLYDEDAQGPAVTGEEAPPARLRYQSLEQAPLEYRDLVRRYFATLDSLRRAQPDGAGELP